MKRFSFTLFLSLFYFCSHAGLELLFCTNPDSLGTCRSSGETFEWKGDKTFLELLIIDKDTIDASRLKLKLYSMKNDRDGELYADLGLAVPSRTLFVVKKMYFYKPGYYKVDVLDEKEGVLATGFVTVTERME